MIKHKFEFPRYNLSKTEWAKEYMEKLPFYNIALDLKTNIDLSRYDVETYICVIVSVEKNIQVINQITGVSKKGKLRMEMIGRTNINGYKENTFCLAELSFLNDTILSINNLMVLLDEIVDMVGDKYILNSPDVMDKICISMFDFYVAGRFLGKHTEMYMDGTMSISY